MFDYGRRAMAFRFFLPGLPPSVSMQCWRSTALRLFSVVCAGYGIRMNFALSPGRRLEALSLERNQPGLLFRLENLQGHPPRGSVDAAASDLAVPDHSAGRHVVEIDKRLSL